MRGTILAIIACFCVTVSAAVKPHVVNLGQWQTVSLPAGTDGKASLKIRGLYVDGKLREHTVGPARDITQRLFVVRRVFQVNDALPEEKRPSWQWQMGGWISVDRLSGRISQLSLPEFDATHSDASWYRDYVGYCGRSEDGSKAFAVVAQLGRRKPVFRQLIKTEASSTCGAPVWQRDPARVTFKMSNGESVAFPIGLHEPGLAIEEEPDTQE